MKTKIFVLFILVVLACLPLKALAYERNFPAGSIIIPMDSFYQPETDGGQLEAYGLAYYLLDHQDQQCLIDAPTDPVVVACLDNCSDGDTACEQECVETFQEECEHTVALSWVINDQKTTIGGIDLQIEDNTLPRVDDGIDAVVKLYDHDGTTSDLTFNTTGGDSFKKISYSGGIWVIDVQDLEDGVEAEVYAIINTSSWAAVNVHVAQVPFAAPVFRDMRGTPPKIALMNSTEDKTKGNAAILESYLRLAGICSDSYEIVTPNEIAGLAADGSGTSIPAALGPNGPGYDFLWAPHWEGEKLYDGTTVGLAHQDNVIQQIQLFLKSGKGMLAECASIEAFEHNPNGRFLSDKGFGHNGGTNDAADILYNDVTSANAQIGDSLAGFDPEGGHLHNWRPFQNGDPYNFDVLPDVSEANSVYNNTVKRFTIDNTGWDYYVGGYAYGNRDFGYVVYLGGHSYASCSDAPIEEVVQVDPDPNAHDIMFEFTTAYWGANFALDVDYSYNVGGTNYPSSTGDILFSPDTMRSDTIGGWNPPVLQPLQVDFTTVALDDKGKKVENLVFRNTIPYTLTLERIKLTWTDGDANLKIKKLVDVKTDTKHYDSKEGSYSPFILHPNDMTIDPLPAVTPPGTVAATGCTNNSGCAFKNLAGVRYVLNTLFNIKYQVNSHEYVRSAPIVAHPWLYQGTFEHPSYFGHFRRFNVTAENPAADWDTAVGNRVLPASTGNAAGRKVYTAEYDADADDWLKINFDAANVDALIAGLDVEPGNGSTADEIRVIERLRGREWDYDNNLYVEQDHNKLGGIMHSAPVIVRSNLHDSRFSSAHFPGRVKEMAYVGDLYGMLHAIETATGLEKWAYIPSNLLDKLQNDRTDPNAEANFAAVDGSPTAKDIYYDHDGNGVSEWRTILVCAQGFGGNSIFALDVTDPDDWFPLWEATDDPSIGGTAPGGGMGYSFRAALDKVKVPVYVEGNDDPVGYKVQWMVYVATSFAHIAEDQGGINIFAFDLETGTEQWTFSSTYADSVNDIPGAVTTYDINDDNLADRIFVGDMNGRMWEIALTDDPAGKWTAGESVHEAEVTVEDVTSTVPIPLFNGGVGNPISVSPAIITRNGHVLLIFGTGGADWASNDQGYNVFAVDATAAGNLDPTDKQTNFQTTGGATDAIWNLPLAAGEKVWSSPTISAGQIWIVTSFGTLESADPRNDRGGSSKLRLLNLDGTNAWDEPLIFDNKKVRGSIYVSRKHVYMSTFDGDIIQLGDDNDYSPGTGNRVALKSWQQQ